MSAMLLKHKVGCNVEYGVGKDSVKSFDLIYIGLTEDIDDPSII